MLKSLKGFITEHKYVFYIYIAWCIIHVVLFLSGGMINGQYDSGFFPFDGFDVRDYGLIELFVYVLAIPVLAYLIYDVAATHRVFKNVLKWVGIVLASIVELFLVFYIVSLFFDGDYDRTGKVLGTYLGWCLAFGTAWGIQFGLTDWLSETLVYSRFGSANRSGLKLVYIFVFLPIITLITAAIVASVLTNQITRTLIQDWSSTEWWIALIVFSLWFIGFYISGVSKVFNKKRLAEAAILLREKGKVAFEKNKLEEAKRDCEKALRIWETFPEDQYPEKANAFLTLGQIHLKEEQYEAAREDYEKGLAIRRAELGDNHRVIAATHDAIGAAQWAQG